MKSILIVLLLICAHVSGFALKNEDSLYLSQHYTKMEFRIPMRDGITLHTVVYTPKDNTNQYPILFMRTPYNVAPYGSAMDFSFRRGLSPAFLREKFIFVLQDVRGRFMSEGTFRHIPPFINKKVSDKDIDEGSDAYDTIDWLIRNLKNHNGRVGMWGISYPGYYASCAAINSHPALKCVSPQAPIGDWFFDDMHHHGAFFLAANFDFLSAVDIPNHGLTTEWPVGFNFGASNGFTFFSNLIPLSRVKEQYFGDSIAFWNDLVNHPNYDEFWQKRNILPHLKNIKPAMLIVGGWYDAEDLYGTFKTYKSIETNNPGASNSIVIGPWMHGGWARTDGSCLGKVCFEQQTAVFYRDSIELPFFNYYLKDKGSMRIAEATVFMTGENQWKKYSHWPPKNTERKKLYLQENKKLSFNPTGSSDSFFDEFISDPENPVTYSEDSVFGMTKEYMTDDQLFAAKRPDVMVYETTPLDKDIVLAGPSVACLKVSTSAGDADWIVKLIDVYPPERPKNPSICKETEMNGYQQMVRSEVIRGRFRRSYETPIPFEPGKIEEVNFELQDVLHCFKKGHKIMIQVQSTWFPLVDINPQKYVPNIFEARAEDFVKATHRIYHQTGSESYIEVGLLK